MKDYFYRVEFQECGSPHIHCGVWMDDAPVYGVNGDKDIVTEVDNNVLAWNNGNKPGRNPEGLSVMVGAPTGKSVHNVHGNTSHLLFKILPNFSFDYKPLASDKLNTF